MASVTQETIATGAALGQMTRPARALVGWMSQAESQLTLAGRNIAHANLQPHVERATATRLAVASREESLGNPPVISEAGPELAGYITEFTAQPSFDSFRTEGWQVKVADLSRVCALQPVVFWDHAEERAQSATPGEMLSLAEVTLPIRRKPEEIPLQFDQHRNTWMVVSRNPNLRILGQFNSPVRNERGQDFIGCGFLFAITPSFVQVISYRGKYLLRDGYHRSLGLLARGMTHVPVLFREFGEFENLGLGPGMLPEQAYLGKRPPLLSDYLNESVSAEIHLPASQKMIVIQGMEMNPLG